MDLVEAGVPVVERAQLGDEPPRAEGRHAPARRTLDVAILADMLEEGWPSMDLVADVLIRELPLQKAWPVAARLVRPGLVPVIRRLRRSEDGAGSTADRVFNRFWLYRRALLGPARSCDVFHVVDHSYAHLALALPRGQTIVTCHDTDTFRGFVTPGIVDTGLPPLLVRRLAAGLKRAAVVACPSRATAHDVISAGLAAASQVVVVPNGVDPAPVDPRAEHEADRLLRGAGPTLDILHVGSTIPRKRIDLLLEVFAAVAARRPEARLLRVGGGFTADQEAQARRLGVAGRTLVLPFLSRETLQAVYRHAALLVITSDREGFGLPVLEGLRAGLPVLARDLPVLREVAGGAAVFVDGTDPRQWCEVADRLLVERAACPDAWASRCEAARARARRFSWSRYAEEMAGLYARVAGRDLTPGGDARTHQP
jgi:glycosyltransferase involved in cell wall biosynthesis